MNNTEKITDFTGKTLHVGDTVAFPTLDMNKLSLAEGTIINILTLRSNGLPIIYLSTDIECYPDDVVKIS